MFRKKPFFESADIERSQGGASRTNAISLPIASPDPQLRRKTVSPGLPIFAHIFSSIRCVEGRIKGGHFDPYHSEFTTASRG